MAKTWALSFWGGFRRNFHAPVSNDKHNTEVEGNNKVQTDRNNQNVIYDQTEVDEDAICGEQYDELVFENEYMSWAEEILNKNKITLNH